ncbi:MAG TPA: winged helix-turn-helix domain-containing protein [Bryobacteraceae bacterium]
MDNPEKVESILRFQGFELNLQSGELRRNGIRVNLQDQPFKVLVALLQRPGQIVAREELRRLIWPHESIGDFNHAINLAVAKLRSSLGDSADVPRLIETLPRRGYRFIGRMAADAVQPAKKHPPVQQWSPLFVAALLLLVAAVVLLAEFGGLRSRLFSRAPSQMQIRSVAVLPLVSLSNDQDQGFFTEGMAEALITELGNISALRVPSHQSVMQYRSSKKPAPQIARELNVDALVEGSIIRAGDQVRITVQLIDGRTDRHLWAGSYQRELRAILSLQNDVARAIATEVKVKLTPREEQPVASARSVGPEAQEAYLKGLYYVNRWPEPESSHCIESFRRATELEPQFADAQAGLATCYSVMPWTYPPKEVLPKAKAAALEAIRLDPNQAEAYMALCSVNVFFEWDWASAERNARRALELSPNRSYSHVWYSNFLAFLGRSEEAVREAKEAVRLDPTSILMNRNLAFVYQLSHRYSEYAAQAQKTLELAPSDDIAKWDLAYAFALQGRRNQAAEHLNAVTDPVAQAVVWATLGEKKRASRALKEAEHPACPCPFCCAMAHAALGDRDAAIQLLEKACDQRDAEMVQLYTNPAFDSMRSDPRVQALLHRMNFPK